LFVILSLGTGLIFAYITAIASLAIGFVLLFNPDGELIYDDCEDLVNPMLPRRTLHSALMGMAGLGVAAPRAYKECKFNVHTCMYVTITIQ